MNLEHVEFHEGYGTVDRVDAGASGLYRRHPPIYVGEMIGCRERQAGGGQVDFFQVLGL